MKNKPLTKIDISVSQEHKQFEPQIRKAFDGLDIHFIGEYVRLSQGDLPMQIFIFLTNAVVGGIAWDLLKAGITKLWKQFPKIIIVLRDTNAIMFALKPNSEVITIVVPDRKKEFEHIKTLDDVIEYLKQDVKVSKTWNFFPLSAIGTFFKGSSIAKNQIANSGLNAVRYGELYTRYNVKIQNVATHIHPQIALESTKIQYGDILFAGSGETNEEIGKSAVYLCKEDGYAGGDTIIFRPNKNVDGLFLAYQLNIGAARKRISELGQGQSVVHLYPRDLKNVQVALPPLPEQERIVAVLETWDEAISVMNKKISLLKNRKTVLAHDLLLGRKRLHNFSKTWKSNEIGELLSYEQPTRYLVQSNEYSTLANTPVLTANKSFILGYTKENDGIFSKIPVIIFDDFTMASRFVDFPFKIKSSAIKLLRPKNLNVNLLFVSELMQLLPRVIGEHKRNYISEYQYRVIEIPEINEQNAIAEALTSMNSEIALIEKKLKAFQNQKNYLLNHLMTGSIRVPDKIIKL